MARIEKGSGNLTMQPDREVDEEQDGSAHGQVTFEGDAEQVLRIPRIGASHPWPAGLPHRCSSHPDVPSLTCFARKITFLKLGRVRGVLDYIGLTSDPTPMIYEFVGSTGEEPITTHDKFVTTLGGTKAAKLNGAKFDAQTGEFICFPPDAGNDLGGVESYLDPRVTVRATYWTYRAPSARNLGQRVSAFPGMPSGRALQTSFTWRQHGLCYQVTDERMSPGKRGWNALIYP